jgi:hypothetical protein
MRKNPAQGGFPGHAAQAGTGATRGPVSTYCFAPDLCAPGSDTILKFTSGGAESTCATGLTNPRGLAFDSSGNLFVAETNFAPDGDILKFSTCGATPTVFATGLNRPHFLTFGPPR